MGWGKSVMRLKLQEMRTLRYIRALHPRQNAWIGRNTNTYISTQALFYKSKTRHLTAHKNTIST